MSINQDRHYVAGKAALAAVRPSTMRRSIPAQSADAPPTRAASLPANVLELYPGATARRRTGIRRLLGSEAGMATAE
jgi:hypothetical protein